MGKANQLPDLSGIADKLELKAGESVEEKYREFLELVRHGRYRLDELADGLGINGVEVEYIVRVAEQHGDVVREGYTTMDLYTIHLTEKGNEKVKNLTDAEQVFAKFDMMERDWKVLQIIDKHGPCTAQTILEEYPEEIAPMKLIPSVNHLVRIDYCDEAGLWRRKLSLTDEGTTTIDQVRNQLDATSK